MQDLLLLIPLMLVFASGYFLMKRLDGFLETNARTVISKVKPTENSLRIGFFDSLTVGSLADSFEIYSKMQGDVFVNLFCGTKEELLKEFFADKLDVVFLPKDVVVPEKKHYNMGIVLLNHTSVIMIGEDLVIKPITEENIPQKVFWTKKEKTSHVSSFIRCLKKRTDWRNADGESETGF